jgi:dihydrolipoamide dehydrogenase
LATGSRPDFSSSHGSRFFNSDDLIARVYPPSHLFIIGGGYVGCEFASIYRALGCRVTLVEERERLLPAWDASVGELVAGELSANGVEVHTGRKVEVEKVPQEDGYPIFTEPDGDEISPDLVLVATGRRPNVESIGLEGLGIALSPFVEVDAQLRTSQRHIFAIGDVNGLNLLDSSASAQARIAIEAIRGGDALFSSRWVPRYLDTDPPAAAVGWMETDANEAGLELEAKSETVRLVTSEDRTVAEPSRTQVKLIAERRTKKVRGCVIIGNGAAEVINVAALAIQSGVTTSELERLFLVHPSVSVALQRCAAKFR